jgi:hypothetical protein
MKRPHRIIPVLACAAAVFSAGDSLGQIASTFDSDLDGWTAVGFDFDATIALPPTLTITKTDNAQDVEWADTTPFAGNPGGFALFTDEITDPGSFLEAPAKFTGDLSAFAGQTISYDHRLFNEGSNVSSIGPYVIVLVNGDPNDLNAYVHIQDGPTGGDTDWQTISTTLDASNFQAIADIDLGVLDPAFDGIVPSSIPLGNFSTDMTFEQVLADVTDIYISFELVDNNSTQVSESAGVDNVVITPEPTSLALLGLGGLLFARRRR